MKEFIDLIQQLFPLVTPDIASNTYKVIEAELKGKDKSHLEFIGNTILKEPSQGDIITGLNLPYIDDKGNYASFDNTLGMLLSCGCDFDRDKHVKIAAMHPLDALVQEGFSKSDIVNQTITGFMYIPMFEYEGREYVVDFSVISSVSTDLLKILLHRNVSNRIASLNQMGYYFLLAKLSIHFLRPEDEVSQTERIIS